MIKKSSFYKILILFNIFLCSIIFINNYSFISSNQTIKIGTYELYIYFDPYKYNRSTTLSLNQHIFESLVSIDNSGKVIPLLAESWTNPDDKTWIFKLRKNIFFTNGSKLTADDVIFSFERVKLQNNSETNPEFGINLTYDRIDKLDEYTIKIITENPFPTFLYKLRNCSILPKHYIEKNGIEYFIKNPIGTGPYMNPTITGIENGKVLTLLRNEKYWGKKPYFKKVEFYITSENNLKNMLVNGIIDLLVWIEPDFYLRYNELKNYKKLNTPGLRTTFLMLNVKDSPNQYISLPFNPLTNRNIRKALYFAINLKELVEKIFSDTATPANQLVSPYVFGYNPSISLPELNINLSRQLLKEANLSSGFSIVAHVIDNDTTYHNILSMIKEYLSIVNINLNISIINSSEFSKIRKNGSFAIIPYSLSSGTGDALFVVSTLLHSKVDSWGTYNTAGYKNETVDKLIENINYEFDENNRIKLYQDIMALAMNDLVFIPLYWPNILAIAKNSLKWNIRSDERVYAFEMSY